MANDERLLSILKSWIAESDLTRVPGRSARAKRASLGMPPTCRCGMERVS